MTQLDRIEAKLDKALAMQPLPEQRAAKARRLTLVRRTTGDHGTFGSLQIEWGTLHLATGECPWRDNQPNVSCIPAGTYQLTRNSSPRFGDGCIISPTHPRTHILIHRGNFCGDVEKGLHSDVKGCVIVGTGTGTLRYGGVDQQAVVHSADAFGELMRRLWKDGDKAWELEISWAGDSPEGE